MTVEQSKIIYTKTDEAPALATQSFLPIIEAFAKQANVGVELRDISLAARILSQFPEFLEDSQKHVDELSELGKFVKTPEANIIKLPNISASIPQLTAAIKELRDQGFKVPMYPADAKSDEEKSIKAKYAKVLGSAVNPVLREGNSDRRVAKPVKDYAKAHPHSMGAWDSSSKTEVSSMSDGDFYSSEQSHVMAKADTVKIVLETAGGESTVLKDSIALQKDEIIDASRMSVKKLREYFEIEMNKAKESGVLLSLHMKATMMKVSDPIIFGHAVSVYYKNVFEQFGADLAKAGAKPNNGVGQVLQKAKELAASEQAAIEKAIELCYQNRPDLAMVDSDKGITNLHVPSDVIIDASMPAMIRSSGKMWNKEGKLQDTKCLIPDRSYAGIYAETVDFCREHGAFDPSTMGNVSNVGLMAQKAEEYGSHDKTFEIAKDGAVRVYTSEGEMVFEHQVEKGDIWRMCQTKDEPVRDWVKLAVGRAKATGAAAVFWLDPQRAHDSQLIKKVELYLKDHDTSGLDIRVMSPVDAMKFSLRQVKEGKDTISVTGNVLRDYLTDLFPILELGTSAKMLSIVPLLNGGGLYETGAGGSAPKHVQQFAEEGHLRWDSLGEFLALAVSMETLAEKTANKKLAVIAEALTEATSCVLSKGKSPLRKVHQLDNRGSHFYLATYWAEALSKQDKDAELKAKFEPVAANLKKKEEEILAELDAVQGKPVDLGGYFHPSDELLAKAMRPSESFNEIIEAL